MTSHVNTPKGKQTFLLLSLQEGGGGGEGYFGIRDWHTVKQESLNITDVTVICQFYQGCQDTYHVINK